MVKNILAWSLASLTACGCNSLDIKGLLIPTSEVIEKRFALSMQMIGDRPTAVIHTADEYMFYACADPHIDNTSENLSRYNMALRSDGKAAFGTILGDCTDRKDNLPAYIKATEYDPQQHLYCHKIFHVLGNHDIYFNGWNEYRTLIGPSVYWFEVKFPSGCDLYISLDTASGTLGAKQMGWLKDFLKENRDKYRHCIILTHTNIFYTDNSQVSSGNLSMEEHFAFLDLISRSRVTLMLQGHDHFREELTYENVKCVVIGTIRDEADAPEYLKVNVASEGISLDWQKMPHSTMDNNNN